MHFHQLQKMERIVEMEGYLKDICILSGYSNLLNILMMLEILIQHSICLTFLQLMDINLELTMLNQNIIHLSLQQPLGQLFGEIQ